MLPQVSLARARAALVLDEGVEHTDNNSLDFTVSDHCRTFLDVKKIMSNISILSLTEPFVPQSLIHGFSKNTRSPIRSLLQYNNRSHKSSSGLSKNRYVLILRLVFIIETHLDR